MNVAIVGGTGTVGGEAARALSSRGHDVRVLSRRAPEYPVDLTDGSGLTRALEGIEAVVDASQGGRDVLVEGTRRLLAAELAAGVRHHVGVSIVGIDRVGGRYYKAKLDQEAEIVRAGVPWTIVRATQFHQLVDRVFGATARFGVLPSVPVPVQPVDPTEVGRLLAEMAENGPFEAIMQFAGPEVVGVDELARRWRESTGSRALPIRFPVPRRLRDGELTSPGAWRGKVTFERWLASS